MKNLYEILLVEDEESSAFLIKEFLEEFGFKVDIQSSVTSAVSNIKFHNYSVILLDINLPDFSGFEVLKFLNNSKFNIPVIILSAYSDKNHKLQAFKFGASDYMVKPIDPEELEARIWVQLKKSSPFKNENMTKEIFKTEENTIFFKDNPLKLTKIEFDILTVLIKNKNQTIKREILLDILSSQIKSDRSLDFHIKNIRLKLAENATNPKYLTTEYGVGYKLIY